VGNNRGSQKGCQRARIENYSHDNLLKETELKTALTGSTGKAKGSPPKKAKRLKKGKTLTLGSYHAVGLRDVVSMVMRLLMNENQESQ
jgi:hypothetical protein